MRIEICFLYFIPIPFLLFQRSNSENEDWNVRLSKRSAILGFVSKVKLRKWGLKFYYTFSPLFSTSEFQRSNSENEDWNIQGVVIDTHAMNGFKGQTQKMRIEIKRFGDYHYVKSWVSKVKLRKWGLKWGYRRELVHTGPPFQRSNSENEDWNLWHYWFCNDPVRLVSKVKLRKWGLKYAQTKIFLIKHNRFQRSNSENEDWNFTFIVENLRGLGVSKVKLRKWGLKYNWQQLRRWKGWSFQRSNSENEDWNSRERERKRERKRCFKGQTQKMRIEIAL